MHYRSVLTTQSELEYIGITVMLQCYVSIFSLQSTFFGCNICVSAMSPSLGAKEHLCVWPARLRECVMGLQCEKSEDVLGFTPFSF